MTIFNLLTSNYKNFNLTHFIVKKINVCVSVCLNAPTHLPSYFDYKKKVVQ